MLLLLLVSCLNLFNDFDFTLLLLLSLISVLPDPLIVRARPIALHVLLLNVRLLLSESVLSPHLRHLLLLDVERGLLFFARAEVVRNQRHVGHCGVLELVRRGHGAAVLLRLVVRPSAAHCAVRTLRAPRNLTLIRKVRLARHLLQIALLELSTLPF